VELDGWACRRGRSQVPVDGGVSLLAEAVEGAHTHGLGPLAQIVGEYAFVAWNPDTRLLVAARDPLASRPLFWTWDGRRLAVASRVPDLLGMPGFSRSPDEAAIAELICERPATTTATVWAGIQRLRGGHALLFDASRSTIRFVRFWNPDPGPAVEAPSGLLRDAVRQAVRRRAREGELIGCELSGGFDSSTTFGTALALGVQARPYSTVYPGQPCDETELIKATHAYLGVEGRLLEVVPPSIDQRRACVQEHGLIGDYVLGGEAPMRAAAADGCQAILTGDFGDEVLGGIGYEDPDALHRLQRPALRRLAFGPRRRQLLALAYRDRLRRRIGGHLRREWQKPLPFWIPDSMAKRVELKDRLAAAEPVPAEGPPSFRALMAIFDGWWTQSRSDLGGVDVAPRAEERTPLADLELVELSLRIPQAVKATPSDRRHLHRAVFADVLAPAVRERTDKAEFSAVIHTHLAAGPDLLAGTPAIVDFGWVEPTGLERLRDEVRAARPTLAYTRNLWVYATLNELELWAQELVV
jgi:asparagine synthase (glutamine-hydrolysing)